MNELTEFKWVNNSPTTVPQQKLMSKVAKHFGMSNKLVRACVDLVSLEDRAVVRFNMPNNSITEEFYIAQTKLNFNELINPKKFYGSKFYAEWVTMTSGRGRGDTTFVTYDASLHVLYDMDALDHSFNEGGGIYINYNPGLVNMIVLPIDRFLALRYPTPL